VSFAGNGGAAPYTLGAYPYIVNQGNPLAQIPGTFFHRRAVLLRGRRQDLDTLETQQAGVLRRLWAPIANMISAGEIFNWSRNLYDDAPDGVNGQTTTSVRYLISTRNIGAGNGLVNPQARQVFPYENIRHAPDPLFIRAGQQQGRPTVRNRLSSFSSRVPPINPVLPSENV
jgi:hypothetical protein